jgi:hypothetical protein
MKYEANRKKKQKNRQTDRQGNNGKEQEEIKINLIAAL